MHYLGGGGGRGGDIHLMEKSLFWGTFSCRLAYNYAARMCQHMSTHAPEYPRQVATPRWAEIRSFVKHLWALTWDTTYSMCIHDACTCTCMLVSV